MKRPDRGSVLMLMPAGVLVVLLLGAIAFDMSLVFLRQREASAVAVDVANDVVTAALDEDHFRATGEYVLDEQEVDRLARSFAGASDLAEELLDLQVTVLDPTSVEITLTAQVDYVFARAIPGAAPGTTVTASASATTASAAP